MNARLATVLIFLFCGTMTVLLVRSVLYPEESRLAAVEPHVPFDLFAARSQGSDLDIWEGNNITGRCHVVPSGGATGPLVRQDKIEVRFELLLKLRQKILDSDLIAASGTGMLHADGKVDDYKFDLSLANSIPSISLSIKHPAKEKWPVLKLMHGKAVIFESSAGKLLEGNEGFVAAGMLQALGISPDALSGQKEEAAVPSTVRAGHIEAGGQSFDGYLFTSGADEETKFRLYMANTGEILRIKTPLGTEMLAESLRPAGVKAPKLERYSPTNRQP